MKSSIIFLIIIALVFENCTNPTKEVFSNFYQHEKEIVLAKQYFSKIKLNNFYFWINFNSDNTLNLRLSQKDDQTTYFPFASIFNNSVLDSEGNFSIYDAELNNEQVQVALKFLNTDSQQIINLKEILRQSNCMSISNSSLFNRKCTVIGYRYPTDGLYGLSYVIFDNPLEISTLREVEEDCSYKVINANIAVEYSDSGPTYGSDCFPDKK